MNPAGAGQARIDTNGMFNRSGVEGWAKEDIDLSCDDSVNLRGFLRMNPRRFPLWGLHVGRDGELLVAG